MKTQIAIVILAVACVGLFIVLLATNSRTTQAHKADAERILDFSNQWANASDELDRLRQVNLILTNDLSAARKTLLEVSNQLAQTGDTLSNTVAAYQGAQEQITNLNGRISDLEARNQDLDERAAALSNTVAGLDAQIAETQRKLADSETNNAFLAQELKRQLAEKAELQRKFDTLSVVRAQVKKLRADLAIARRVEWMREGTYTAAQEKGAQRLMSRGPLLAGQPARPPHYDLNVEVGSDGSVRIIPALTNAPDGTNAPQ
ncbi:MAG: hypothetical protein KGJ60_06620 [Verrucomicrobiota bacterium]|nr:hypothetical protein [Verrucomicrobiota bacterium]